MRAFYILLNLKSKKVKRIVKTDILLLGRLLQGFGTLLKSGLKCPLRGDDCHNSLIGITGD